MTQRCDAKQPACRVFAAAMLIAALAGCSSFRHHSETEMEPATRPSATDVDPIQATPDYWLAQPAVASATSNDFQRLFSSAEGVARRRYFLIDQADRRSGLIVTAPETSKQFFEFWRNDTGTIRETIDSSLATERRTLRYEFTRNPDGTYTVVPRVLIERYSTEGRRVTVPAQAYIAFDPPPEENDPAYQQHPWDATYWYPVGRDTAMERQLVKSIKSRLKP